MIQYRVTVVDAKPTGDAALWVLVNFTPIETGLAGPVSVEVGQVVVEANDLAEAKTKLIEGDFCLEVETTDYR